MQGAGIQAGDGVLFSDEAPDSDRDVAVGASLDEGDDGVLYEESPPQVAAKEPTAADKRPGQPGEAAA
jgi:hypothetical protein